MIQYDIEKELSNPILYINIDKKMDMIEIIINYLNEIKSKHQTIITK